MTVAALRLMETKPLPKLYHGICNKRDVQVSDLRAFEKQGLKVVKLELHVRYLFGIEAMPGFLKVQSPEFQCIQK